MRRLIKETLRSRYAMFFVFALLAGGALRFYRLDWGRPNVFHPDEARVSYAVGDIDRQVATLQRKTAGGEEAGIRERISAYNPHFFAYGSFPLYLIRTGRFFAQEAGRLVPGPARASGGRGSRWRSPDLFVIGRGISAFFDTLTILMLFLIGKRLFSMRAGALGSLFFAFTVFHIQLSHFITVDVTLAGLIVVTIYFCARIMEEGRARHYLLAGFFGGLAIATKFTAVPILLPILFAHLAFCRRERRFLSIRQWGKFLLGLAAGGACFILFEPFFILDHKEFIRQLREQRSMVLGKWAPPWTYQYAHTIRGFYQLKNLVAYCMGPPLGVAVMGGFAYILLRTLRKPDRGVILLLMWLLPVGCATVSFQIKFLRYFAPLIPFLCLLGAQGICRLYEQARDKGWGLAVRVAVGLAVAYSLFYSLAYVNIYRHKDTRIQASNWIYENVPKGSKILNESWEFMNVPMGTDKGNAAANRYSVKALDVYKPDDRGKARYLASELAKADVIALSTKRMYGSILRIPERYPVTSNYFRLLFEGRLGFKLAESATSYPRLLGVQFNDDYADESFTVYDHPKSLVFRKVAQYPEEYLQRLIASEPKISYWPVLYDALGADRSNRPDMNTDLPKPALDGYTPKGYGNVRAVIVWLLMIELMGLIALPLTSSFLGNLGDRGYPFAKVMAVALTGYLVWIAASLGIAPFSRATIVAALGIVAVLSWLFSRRRPAAAELYAKRRRTGAASEIVFLVAFSLFLAFRMFNPDIFWSESSMDFSFINSILRSRYFPPIDPWASGIYLNYYYYGHYIVALLTKLSGIPSYITYNLAFCLIPALVISGVYSIIYTLTGRVRYGILGGVFAGLMGNLDGFFLLIDTFPWRESFYKFLHIAMPTHAEGVFRFFRCAHEVIPHTVHEFPLWSFIFVDLHAHVIAMPFAVTLLAWGLNCVRSRGEIFSPCGGGARGIGHFLIAAVLLGMMVPMNTWDFPIYLILLGLIFLARDILLRKGTRKGIPLSAYSIWWGCSTGGRILRAAIGIITLSGAVGRIIKKAARAALFTALLAGVALAAFSPFFMFFGREGMGIGTVGNLTTHLNGFLRFFGFFFFIIASYLYLELMLFINGSPGRFPRVLLPGLLFAAALTPWAVFAFRGDRDYAALSLSLALALPLLIALRKKRDAVYPVLLVVYGMAVVSFCEIFHIRDFLQGGAHKRMNTIFKFYMPVWFFFSIGCAFFVSRILARGRYHLSGTGRVLSAVKRVAWCILFILLFAASLVFSVMGPRARTIGNDNYNRPDLSRTGGILGLLLPKLLLPPTLDGFAYMKPRRGDEYDAIFWLNDKIKGQPVIVEATGGDYLYEYARISSNTGIPTVIGWHSHVDQRGYPYRDIRKADIIKLYKSAEPLDMLNIIAKYDIRYVYVGETERRIYSPQQLEKFDTLTQIFTPVFKEKNVSIYRTSYLTPLTGEEKKSESPAAPAEARPLVVPRVKITSGGRGDAPGEYAEPRGIAIGPDGDIYVADFRNYRIQKFDSKGNFVKSWGEEGDFPGQFKDPCGVAVGKNGQVYVADTFNHRVQAFTPDGKYLFGFEGGFFAPRGLAVDPKGRVWVADTGNSVIKLFSGEGKLIKTIGKKGAGKGEFNSPNSVAIDQKGNVYVADTGNRRVEILDRNGNYVSEFKVEGWAPMVFDEPYLAVDDRGDIYLTDPPGNRILEYSRDGKLLGALKPMEGDKPLLSFPMGIAVEEKGNAIYVVDCKNHAVRKFSKRDF